MGIINCVLFLLPIEPLIFSLIECTFNQKIKVQYHLKDESICYGHVINGSKSENSQRTSFVSVIIGTRHWYMLFHALVAFNPTTRILCLKQFLNSVVSQKSRLASHCRFLLLQGQGRSQAGRRGCQLEVGAQRPPRLLSTFG